MSTRNTFLSGENTNLVVQQIVGGLTKYGIDIDIKGLQGKIINFMAKVQKEYPNQDLTSMNNFVINKCVEKYLNNRPQFNQDQGKGNLSNQFERELMSRGYTQNHAPQVPPRPDFSQPMGFQQPSQSGGRMSLNQARGGQTVIEPPDIEQPVPIPSPTPQIQRPETPVSHQQYYQPSEMEEILLSLNKSDLISISGNTFTFSWNRKIVSDFRDNFQMKLEYLTIPKRLPYLLVKYDQDQSETKKVYSASGKNYSAKMIPYHTSDEYTTYQVLGNNLAIHDSLPHTLTFQLIPPHDNLQLNIIPVQKITKNKSQIHIVTKYPHNLSSSDNLILEFPQQHTCYKVSNLQILDQKQILVDSPFVGYFSSDFKLLRNDWNIDLTLCCRYNKL